MLESKADTDLLEALLEAEIEASDVLGIIDMWMNGSREDAIDILNSD